MTDVFESKSKVYKVNLSTKKKQKIEKETHHIVTTHHVTLDGEQEETLGAHPSQLTSGAHPSHLLGRESPNPAKQRLLSQLQLESLTAQVDRLRVLLREKEIESVALKNENSMLKQRERRNQRDMETLEQETIEAPILIRRLKEELSLSKAKVKSYYGQIGDDSRVIRQMHEERTKMKDQITRLEELVDQKKLADRDALSTQLKDSNLKILELQKLVNEAEKKLEMVDRNLNTDNKYLRGKINAMEKERELLADQLKSLEENVKEKEKVIASLSIYRYNAIHKSKDTSCKVCAKREKDELESKRKAAIIAFLPSFAIKGLTITNNCGVKFQLDQSEFVKPDIGYEIPSVAAAAHSEKPKSADGKRPKTAESVHSQPANNNGGPVYSQLRLVYSTDPLFLQNVQRKKLDTVSYQKNNDFTFNVDGLTPGLVYYFSITPGHLDIFAPPPHPISLLVDVVPNPPIEISTFILHDPPSIQVRFKPSKEVRGSPISRFRVYQSNSVGFEETYLAIDSPAEEVDHLYDSIFLTLRNAHTAVPYYFKVVSVNGKGESGFSECSGEVIIDYVPEQPTKPVIKRVGLKSIHMTSTAVNGLGVFPSKFKVTMKTAKEGGPTTTTNETTFTVPVKLTANGKREAHYTANDVDAGALYSFSVVAINSTGESVPSEWSEDTDIDFLVPALPELQVSTLSATSFSVVAPSSKEIKQPIILGYKVKWASNSDITENVRTSALLACDQKPFVVDGLVEGELIHVNAFYVGEQEEGMACPSVFVPLASYIPLPSTPIPVSASREQLNSEAPPPGDLKTANSGSSRFSVTERPQINFGYAGYHEPPPNPNRTKIRQNPLRRSQTLLETGAAKKQGGGIASRKTTLLKDRGNGKGSTSSLKNSTVNRSGSLPHLSK